jgi:hypothetical protein
MFRNALILIALFVTGCDSIKRESFRTPLQTPVSVSIRGSYVGFGNVVQVRNNSDKMLTGVVVTGRNHGQNASASYRVGNIRPGEVRDVGWREWNWKVDADETVTVSADGFLPIIFSSAQLGIR